MVQNHLLQVTGIVAMEPPSNFNATAVRNEIVKVMQALRPMKSEEVLRAVVRGQYVDSVVRGESVAGYRQEKDVASDSRIETFVAIKFFIDNWRWGGVPFYIRTGKRLPTRVTEAVIYFKKTPHMLFSNGGQNAPAGNQLVIRIQPDEGVLIKFGMKVPGAGFDIQTVNMDFHYSDLSQTEVPSAYERLLLDCMLGDATLYARSDAVEACWAFVRPILTAWEEHPEEKLYGYPAGTWGPKEASDLFSSEEDDWRYPCKNLSDDGIYCEL
jgi:glucose-6-phosphate 1-dehydrogenase